MPKLAGTHPPPWRRFSLPRRNPPKNSLAGQSSISIIVLSRVIVLPCEAVSVSRMASTSTDCSASLPIARALSSEQSVAWVSMVKVGHPVTAVVGPEAVGVWVVGSEVVGSEVVGSEVVGIEVVGSDVVGSELVGSEVDGIEVGTAVVGTKVVGARVAGAVVDGSNVVGDRIGAEVPGGGPDAHATEVCILK